MNELVSSLGIKFHGHMLTMHKVGQGINIQRFFTTFTGRYHELSQMGADLLAPYGMLLPSSTYSRVYETVRARSAAECKYVTHMRKVNRRIGYIEVVAENILIQCKVVF